VRLGAQHYSPRGWHAENGSMVRAPSRAAVAAGGLFGLAAAEVGIAIGFGAASAAIASRLGLAPNTVGNHISNLLAKLQVASRAQAIVRARSAGLGG
jgi:DNA-binding NarL/FixJ family response regulator